MLTACLTGRLTHVCSLAFVHLLLKKTVPCFRMNIREESVTLPVWAKLSTNLPSFAICVSNVGFCFVFSSVCGTRDGPRALARAGQVLCH